jgi:TP901 family phage tail tape measure protein
MAIKLFDLGFNIKLENLSNTLRGLVKLHSHMEAVNKSAEATAHMREYSQNLGMLGAGALAAGGVLAGAVAATVGPAMKAQAEWAHVATAMNDGADTMKHLNEVQETTAKLASNGVIGVEQLGQAYYIARSNMLDHADALKAVAAAQNLVTGTTVNAADASAQMESTTRTLTTLAMQGGGSIAGYADQLAKLQSQYSFKDIGEVTNALQYAMPAAKGAGVAVEQMNAALAMLSAGGLHGPEAGTAFQETVAKLTTDNKLLPFVARTKQGGLDLVGTLGNLKAALGNLAPLQRARELKSLGFGERDIRGVDIMMDKVSQLSAVQNDLANSQGAAAKLAAIRMGAADEQLARLANNWDLLKESIGAPLLGAVASAAGGIARVMQHINAFAHAHPQIMKFIVTFAAVTAGVLLLVGGIGLLISALAFVGATVAPVAVLLGVSVGWLAALAAGAIAVAAAIMTWWPQIESFFATMIPRAFNWGANLLKTLAKGIASAVMYPVHAIEGVFGKVARFIPQSPAKEGPLRNLHRARIVETIADTITPAPMVNAIRRVAMATAIAAPMMVGTAAGFAIASSGRQSAAAAAPVVINVTYAPVINGAGSPDEWAKAAKAHADELMRIIDDKMQRRARLSFE